MRRGSSTRRSNALRCERGEERGGAGVHDSSSVLLGPLERAARYNVEVKIPRYNTLRRRRGVRYVPHNVRHVTIGSAACVTRACAARL
jgi:hypothetical protein